jgi:hypothetical protein
MGNLIAIGNFIGLNYVGTPAPGAQDIITELSVQVVTEAASQNVITE